ncbi:LCP family protein [Cytobacillus sp. Hz8]|uniref:LCP family protein n=1 Tax=Cytobacillus sp. Hz8 TaxID=3347168 RepID=UPI0035DF9C60
MNERITRSKKIKKKRRFYKLLFPLFLIILIFSSYSIWQYYSGKQLAKNDKILHQSTFNGEQAKNGKVNVLLLGIDQREDEKTANSDTMIVAQYDTKNNKIKMISLMRDMYVSIPGYQDYKKMNSSYLLGGPELVRKTIKQNFHLDIQYYALIDFKGFEQVIDTLAPDGVEVNVEHAMSKNIGVSLKPGLQKLNGKELLGYARFRHDSQNDFGRVKRQQEVIKIVSDQVLSTNGLLKAPKLLGMIEPYLETNMSRLSTLKYMKDFLLKQPSISQTMSLPIENTYTNESVPVFGEVLKIDEAANREAVEKFLE